MFTSTPYQGFFRHMILRKSAALQRLRQPTLRLFLTMAFGLPLTPSSNVDPPISRLPSELLLCIFLFVRWTDNSTWGVEWIAVSQVCHRWRNLAIGNPLLWNRIDLSYLGQWTDIVQRSQSSSLIVRANLSKDAPHVHSCVEVLPHIATRIVSVGIRVEFPWIHDRVDSKVLTTSAPFLLSISLAVPKKDRHPVDILPTTFFGGRTPPLLYRLKLIHVGFTLPWACPNLKQLEIQSIHARTSCTLNEIITLLQQTPLLTDLVLHDTLSSHVEASYLGNPVELPHLRTFRLGHNLEILDHLALPFDTALALNMYSYQRESYVPGHTPFDTEFVLVAKRLNGEHNNEKIRCIRIGKDPYGGPILQGWPGGVIGSPLVPPFEISVDWWDTTSIPERKFWALLNFTCEALPLADIQILDVGPPRRLKWDTTSSIIGILRAFINVHTLHTSGSSTNNFFAELVDYYEVPERHHIVLSEMSTIVLTSVDFGVGLREWNREHWGGMDGLRRYLAWRADEPHAEIERLEIRGCMNVTEDKLRLMEMIVPEVWWDGELVLELDDDGTEDDEEEGDSDEDDGEQQ
jgi:hypothetical protein